MTVSFWVFGAGEGAGVTEYVSVLVGDVVVGAKVGVVAGGGGMVVCVPELGGRQLGELLLSR